MFTEIIARTPTWVFILFFTLIFLGYRQSKTRKVNLRTLLILPIAMTIFSIIGVKSAFNLQLLSMAAWGVGIAVSFFVSTQLLAAKAIYLQEEGSFQIPGSWLPLMLMMAIFFVKYIVAVLLARDLPITETVSFVFSVSFLYGSFSGIFAARAKSYLQAKTIA